MADREPERLQGDTGRSVTNWLVAVLALVLAGLELYIAFAPLIGSYVAVTGYSVRPSSRRSPSS